MPKGDKRDYVISFKQKIKKEGKRKEKHTQ
jgi:hypothetical protein